MSHLCDTARSVLGRLDDDRHWRVILTGLLMVAFSLRLAAALVIPIEYRFDPDAVLYVSIADNLLESGAFGADPGIPYALIPPIYPLFIACIFAVTNQGLLAVRLVQALLGTLIVWLVYCTGAETATRRAGLFAALLCTVYPVWIIWPALFLTETVYTVLLLGFVWCLIRSLQAHSIRYTLLAGVLFGLALLTREVLLAFILLLPVALWWSRASWRRTWRHLLLFAVTSLLTVTPWLARNYSTFGAVFFTDRTEAIRYQLTGSGHLSARYSYLADKSISPPPLRKPPDFYERFGEPSEWISAKHLLGSPATYFRHLGNRLVELWLHPVGLYSLPDNQIVRALYVAFQVGMLAFSSWGILVGIRQRSIPTGTSTLLLMYVTGTSAIVTMPNPRYTLPALPLIFVLSVSGASSICSSLKGTDAVRKPAASEAQGSLAGCETHGDRSSTS
jgi:4-amino-4-deoxy-L-arabinose transferase-like glycosyltransferase